MNINNGGISMKNTKKILSMIMVLVFMFTVAMSSAVLAETENDKGNGKNTTTEEKIKGNDKNELKEAETETETATVETDEEKAVKEKDKVMEQKKVLKKQLIEARKSGDTVAEAELLAQVKAYMESLKKMVEESYTEEELAQLEQIAESIEAEDPSVEVLPIEKIIAKGKSLKFDLPPVIKEGKVLVPIRAFSQAYGAEVQYDSETQTITILIDGKKIEFVAGSSTVYVDGVATILELPVKNINGRTVMPVGFLAEQLGLKVEVDEEDGTIEIEDEDTTLED
jgi:hypothetical protein